MPLHLLGKKSWNVYNPTSIARVKADEAAAAAREAADEQRMQELDAERRAALLRGHTPPPLPEEDNVTDEKRNTATTRDGHDRKRRRLAGEDDTDRDIRLAASVTGARDEVGDDKRIMKLRKPALDAPLTDHAGNINLFPVDQKEAMKHARNAEAEKEKKKKEQSFADQYTMRFSNAAGRGGLEQPWYGATAPSTSNEDHGNTSKHSRLEYSGLASKDVWGNEDPRRKEREQARITSSDPFALMQQAQVQLKQSRNDKKKWITERDQELRELRAAQERESRRDRHGKRKKRIEDDELEPRESKRKLGRMDSSRSRGLQPGRSSSARHSQTRNRSRSPERYREREREREQRESRTSAHRPIHSTERKDDKDRERSLRQNVPRASGKLD
ncbi:hypothetical protein BDV95DRAFT_555915 [Massariosphaeria phaeospora]|uniref:CBF1-interacting co-repressor CIR N-terminal domain-containing protein n=1 Tax=Massariosphaeria phaeospora TaxID=100035 RepID=A0A7C8MDH9_9PLEO|nr:hypothetical protein BDV95DRAFT_555915 [Massariosphaeria phaeospora]